MCIIDTAGVQRHNCLKPRVYTTNQTPVAECTAKFLFENIFNFHQIFELSRTLN